MSPKIKQALSLFVSTTVVLTQTGVSTYANNTDINQFEQHSQLCTDNLDTSAGALVTGDSTFSNETIIVSKMHLLTSKMVERLLLNQLALLLL